MSAATLECNAPAPVPTQIPGPRVKLCSRCGLRPARPNGRAGSAGRPPSRCDHCSQDRHATVVVPRLAQFGVRLKAARVAAGLNVKQLAAAAGTHASTIVNVEKGRRQLSAQGLVAVATALGVGVGQLAGD